MLVWSGWGICVAIFAVIGFFIGFSVGDALETSMQMAYGPAHAAGYAIGGGAAALGVFFLARWRESGEGRVLVDEASGQRIEVRPSAGSLFFIPTRYWTWILLALFAFGAFTSFSQTEAPPSTYEY
ncbi:MAG: hypothetical protein R3C30_11895 [Hyphomonadaceae bacterium]